MGIRKAVPVDLLVEILRLLPVKSLRRFELVSKSWGSLIHNPLFIRLHLQQAAETNSSSSSSSSLISLRWNRIICFSGVDSPGDLKSFDCHESKRNPLRPVKVLSCNGLLCFPIFDRYVIITNLLSKANDYHMTSIPFRPPFGKCPRNVYKDDDIYYGFGFDSDNDDYKLLTIQPCCQTKTNHCYVETNVFSLRSNAWSQTKYCDVVGQRNHFPTIEIFYCIYQTCPNGVFAYGALHWFASWPNSHLRHIEALPCKSTLILAFSLASEEFFEVPLPEIFRGKKMPMNGSRLGVLKGSLCFSTWARHPQPYNDIWVLKDYQIHASWTRLFRVISNSTSPCPLTPLIYSKSDYEVLLIAEMERCFYSYDLRKRRLLQCVPNSLKVSPQQGSFFLSTFYTAAICLETLVSVSDYKALWEEDDDDTISRGSKRKRQRKAKDEYSCLRGETRKSAQEYDRVKQAQALEHFFIFRDKFNLSKFKRS